VVASPKSGPWWVLCVRVARGWSQHQRCSNYALTTLCGLCAGPCEWISLSILPSPIPELQHAPLPLKLLWAWERIPTPPSSAVFHLDSHLSPARSWECVIPFPPNFPLWAIPIHITMIQKQQKFKIQTKNVPWSVPIQMFYSSYPLI
jgi:hypothetical protein